MDSHREFKMDDLFRTAVGRGANELHIACGHPPVLRIGGQWVPLQANVLEADDCLALMQSITPVRNQRELQDHGETDFGFAFSDQIRFRVSVFARRGDTGIFLRRIPTDGWPA